MQDNSIQVLLFEGDAGDALRVQMALADTPPHLGKFALTHVEGIGEGLKRLGEEHFDVVLLDLGLPQTQGLESLAQVRVPFPNVPIVVLTGLDDETVAVQALKEGAQDFLLKGQVGHSVLVRSIRYAVERKRVEAALHSKAEQFQAILDHGTAIMSVWDLKGRCLHVSREFEKIFRIPANQFIGKTIHDLFSKEVADILHASHCRVLETGIPMPVEVTIPWDDGPRTIFSVRFPLRDAAGQIYAVGGIIATDITAGKRAEEALRESEEKYRGLFESSRDAIMTLEPPSWRFTSGNPATVKMFGVKNEEEFISLSPWELSPERQPDGCASAEKAKEIIETAMREGFHLFEWTHQRIGGEEFFASVLLSRIQSSGKVFLQATVRDITESRRTEGKIRDQAALLDQTNDAVLVRTVAGDITFWNRGAERLFGWTAREIVGRNINETLLAAAPRDKVEAAERRVLEEGYWLGEIAYVSKTGQEIIGQVRATLVRDAAGAPQSFLVLITDLTELKKLETQFLHAQRLEAVGTLADGIAHDLGNVLAPILLGAPLLRNVQTPAELATTLDIIESNARRATDVVAQLLGFSRGQGGKRITFHLKHLLRDLRSIVRETFPKNLKFTSSEAPDLWPLEADPTQLHQMLLNLCINARDAMSEGGTLAVSAANFQVDEQFASMEPGAQPGPYVHLQTSDTGTGIRPEHLDKIFDPFFTTKEVGRGTGLGLATVHKVVTGHGGFVRVRSQVGQGTTFDVYLPASPAAVVHAEPPLPAPALAGQGELILVVDDEEGIRQITQKTLLLHGYRAVIARDGAEAVALFAQHQEAVKAVLTDLMMPVMDGLGLVQVLAQMKPGLPVVVSSVLGSNPAQNEKLAAVQRLGVGVILAKPYTADQLLQALHAVLPPSG